MQTNYQTKQKKLAKKKIFAIALDSDFSIIKKIYSAEEMYNCDFKYIAEFNYDKHGKLSKVEIYTEGNKRIGIITDYDKHGMLSKIEIYSESNKLVCTITDYDIKKVDLNYISKTKLSVLIQSMNTKEGMKNLFFKRCLCSNN